MIGGNGTGEIPLIQGHEDLRRDKVDVQPTVEHQAGLPVGETPPPGLTAPGLVVGDADREEAEPGDL
jgi:hypothetical protein